MADEQVRRDHLVSHVLAALGSLHQDGLVFYGGTALARTRLPRFRLSEDVDLLVVPRQEWAKRIEETLPAALRRGFGTVQWRPAPTDVPSGGAASLVAGDRVVQLQLVTLDREERRWPLEGRTLEMRYADAPPTTMTVPFERMPAAARVAWHVDLDHQMAAPPDPDACLRSVRDAWASALGWS